MLTLFVIAALALAGCGLVPASDLLSSDDEGRTGAKPAAASTTAAVGPGSGRGASSIGGIGDTDDLDSGDAFGVLEAKLRALQVGGSGSISIDGCPVDPGGELVDGVFAGTVDLGVPEALVAEPVAQVFEVTAGEGLQLECSRADEVGTGLGIVAMLAPPDFDTYTGYFGSEFDGVTPEVSSTPSIEFRGGRFHRFCVKHPGATEADFCEVDWFDGNVLIGVYLSASDADRLDLSVLEARLAPRLQAALDNLSSNDGTWTRTT